ncbi:TIR domain-containing anti-phage reverse transcriptase [Paracoccus marcusii]|uniref:TIR domain-containing anti-phage reverse transcriptase n=1 Tax=Paracoccus marcusii TaxID=59779 RepID=UPI0035A738C3
MSEDDTDAPFLPGLFNSLFLLQMAHSVKDVANALELDPEKFFYVVQHANDGTFYRRFHIPKKKGGHRLISAPKGGLGFAQTRLATVLAEKYKPKPFVKGYVKGESFLSNAIYHQNQYWILNIGIKDFYPSITFPRVRGLFMSSYFKFNERVATILARITTTPDGLPQGARTSPIIANLIANNIDQKIIKIAKQEKLKYSRYADDISISSSHKRVPSSVIRSWEPAMGQRKITLGQELSLAFKTSGFDVNDEKTRLLFPYERQEVTGLIVNQKANVWRKDISLLRMKIHSISRHGWDKAASIWIGRGSKKEKLHQHIVGQLSFIRQVRGVNDPVLAKLCKASVMVGILYPEWIVRSSEMVKEFDVFLSHASEDKPKVSKLRDQLIASGLSVFYDADSIKWGDSIPEKINHGLAKSIYFVPFLSETFAKKGWTNKELNSAISFNISRKGRILPIIDANFVVDDNYPLLSDLLYKSWPKHAGEETFFIADVSDSILALVQAEKNKGVAI